MPSGTGSSASPLISCSAGTARGRLVRHSAPHRYVWPSELDLMAKLVGFPVRDRWARWNPAPFTSGSPSQVECSPAGGHQVPSLPDSRPGKSH